jgi:2-amino-4-hydroxy-6-hydroxymethyldihydropteridine diphosphokinase
MSDMPRPSVAIIAVGANIEPGKNILAALRALQEKVHVTGCSTFYRTQPVGRPEQPRFINGAWRIETTLSALEVKTELLRGIEEQLGRRRMQDKFAPRTIDLDLVLYGDLVVNGNELSLPHPDLKRAFVYVPVVELLKEMSRQSDGDLPERMRKLVPQNPPTAEPGERLDTFTQLLRRSAALPARERPSGART